MKSTEINQHSVLKIENTVPDNTPITMLNMLRFKMQANYGDNKDEKSCSGMEAYLERYIPAFNKVVENEGIIGIQVTFIGAVKGLVAGPMDEKWDIIALVQYPSFAAFRKVSESSLYKAIAEPHRVAALEDFKLIATVHAEGF